MTPWLTIRMRVGMMAASPAKAPSQDNDCEQEANWKAWQDLVVKYFEFER